MEYTVKVDEPSKVLRKLTITVPGNAVNDELNKGLKDAQKKTRLKGFRPGHVPLPMVEKVYGSEVLNQVYSRLIDETYKKVIAEKSLRPVTQAKIESVDREGAFNVDSDLTYVATIEVMPDIEVKNYSGFSFKKESVKVTDDEVKAAIDSVVQAHAQVVPIGEERAIKQGDHVDFTFKGGMVTDNGIEEKEGMSGTRLLEVGSNSLIPGFEEELVGLKKGEEKTFRIKFPKDYGQPDFAGKEAEFHVSIHELKKKELPKLDDDFAKEAGYESMDDMNKKAHDAVTRNKSETSDAKLRNDLLDTLIKKNSFDVPEGLIQTQMRMIANDYAKNLKQQGADEEMMKEILGKEENAIRDRAEKQVRSGFILDTIAKNEKIEVSKDELEKEYEKLASSMQMETAKLKEFYEKDQERRENLEFRLKEEKTIKFVLDQCKVK